jgi:hypothetical protein
MLFSGSFKAFAFLDQMKTLAALLSPADLRRAGDQKLNISSGFNGSVFFWRV